MVHSATRPEIPSETMLVVIANLGDPGFEGGATSPFVGYPGDWLGARADIPPGYRGGYVEVAAHDLGHAIGLTHSSVSDRQFRDFPDSIPIMHWVGKTELGSPRLDDIAAISFAYPNPALPLETVSGTIRGRVVGEGTGLPINGVNVVAVDAATGAPAVGRLSGGGLEEGVFDIVGLPPGTYQLHFLDANSFRGDMHPWQASEMQVDNFQTFVMGPYGVSAGQVEDLGDVPIAVEPMSIDGITIDSWDGDPGPDPNQGILPMATEARAYSAWLHVRGGVRPLQLAATAGLPDGLGARIARPLEGLSTASNVNGVSHVEIFGTSGAGGSFSPIFTLEDAHGVQAPLSFDLEVRPISEITDLAITRIRVPRRVRLSTRRPSSTRKVRVRIQNRGGHDEIIPDSSTLDALVDLLVHPLSWLCPAPTPVLHDGPPQKPFPITLRPGRKLYVVFDMTFNCTVDPAKSTRSDPSHLDYSFTAVVSRGALGDAEDEHLTDNFCPRMVSPPYEVDPNPDGRIRDRGCGAKRSDRTYGDPIYTDLVATEYIFPFP